jgi:hypothetical protein
MWRGVFNTSHRLEELFKSQAAILWMANQDLCCVNLSQLRGQSAVALLTDCEVLSLIFRHLEIVPRLLSQLNDFLYLRSLVDPWIHHMIEGQPEAIVPENTWLIELSICALHSTPACIRCEDPVYAYTHGSAGCYPTSTLDIVGCENLLG